MKFTKSVLWLPSLILLAVVGASAQVTTSPPDISIIKKDWRMDVRNPLLDTDPFEANAEFSDAQRAQKMNELQNAIRARGSESREPPPPRNRDGAKTASRDDTKVTYIYRAKIRNTGEKTIRAVEWAYLFFDPVTQQEVGRYRYVSKVRIRPGQDSDLTGNSTTPQRLSVNAGESDKQATEAIVIYRVEYADGSVWQNPPQ